MTFLLFAEDEISVNPRDCTRSKRAFLALMADLVLAEEVRFPLSFVV